MGKGTLLPIFLTEVAGKEKAQETLVIRSRLGVPSVVYNTGMDKKKIGRNDPCPCGSGKKYKHCHYDLDRAKREDVNIEPYRDPISPGIKRLYGIKDNDLGGR